MTFHMRRIGLTAAAIAALSIVLLAGMGIERMSEGTGMDAGAALVSAPASAQGMLFEELPDVIERVVPAVVNIHSKKTVRLSSTWRHPFFDDPFFREFFGIPRRDMEREVQNLGSGVIVRADGYILTNNHLVGEAEEITVYLPDKREFEAQVVGTDQRSDVAVLKIDAKDLPTVPFGRAEKLRLGQPVVAIGYPFGVGQTVTMGIVSALGRDQLNLVAEENFIQTDAAINPGNSGGALINVTGELVGINTAIVSQTGGNQGIGFAIPIELAERIMESLIEHGRVIRGYLGVAPQSVTREIAESFGLDGPRGVIVTEVEGGTPAERGGVKRDDIILEIDGQDIESENQFRRIMAVKTPGDKMEVTVWRDGKSKKLTIEVGEHPESVAAERPAREEEMSPLFTDVSLETLQDFHRRRLDLPDNLEGVIVTEIARSSAAYRAGLRSADVIVEVNKKRITGVGEFNKVLEDSRRDRALLLVYRGGAHYYIVLKAR